VQEETRERERETGKGNVRERERYEKTVEGHEGDSSEFCGVYCKQKGGRSGGGGLIVRNKKNETKEE